MPNLDKDGVGATQRSENHNGNDNSMDWDEGGVRMGTTETEMEEKNVRGERKKMLYLMKGLGEQG
jgi:hypothetical protein